MPDQPTDQPVEQWARAVAGAAALNPKRGGRPWRSLDGASRDHYRGTGERIVSQTAPAGAATDVSDELADFRSLLVEAIDWIPDGDLRERICAALDEPQDPATT